jgi:hypothetical protein
MTNYNETETTAKSWTRSNRIIITNNLGEVPTMYFNEEDVFQINDQYIKQPRPSSIGGLMAYFTDPKLEVPLLHPLTDQPIGTSTYAAIQVLLYSLYRQLAAQRDGPVEPDVVPVPDPVPTIDPIPEPVVEPVPEPVV